MKELIARCEKQKPIYLSEGNSLVASSVSLLATSFSLSSFRLLSSVSNVVSPEHVTAVSLSEIKGLCDISAVVTLGKEEEDCLVVLALGLG